MASERLGVSSCPAAHVSTVAINSSESRIVRAGSLPPVGGRPRPRFFGVTFIDFFINMVVP
jgi:hypothetical protein